MDPVVHFEMPYDDSRRLAGFYEKAFGWRMQQFGEEMGNYVLASTTESDDSGSPKKPGRINGGFFPKQPEWPAVTTVVIEVAEIGAAIDSVKAAGGQVQGEPMEIPGIGRYVAFLDTEGNRVGMLQPPSGA